MQITLAMVMSVDGKTTQGFQPSIYSWTSAEDKNHFMSLINQQELIIMGRKTYEAARSIITLTPNTLRVVVTTNPQQFEHETVPNQLEFSNLAPSELVANLEHRGYTKALLVGGETLNKDFFKEKLVDELLITVEPQVFGTGNNLIGSEEVYTQLQLQSVEKLNEQGTLLLKYTVI